MLKIISKVKGQEKVEEGTIVSGLTNGRGSRATNEFRVWNIILVDLGEQAQAKLKPSTQSKP